MSVETLYLQGPGEHARQKCQSLAVSSSLTVPLGLGKPRERWALEKMAHPGRLSFSQHPTNSAAWSLGCRGGCSNSSLMDDSLILSNPSRNRKPEGHIRGRRHAWIQLATAQLSIADAIRSSKISILAWLHCVLR